MSVAVIGCGHWGKNLVRDFAALGSLSIVCDLTESGRARAHQLAPTVEVVSEIERVLDADVDGVVVATPAGTHHAIARQALLAGKDVFVEKPLSQSLDDAADLVRTADAGGRVLMVGHLMEYHPALLRLLDLIREGVLGSLWSVFSNRLSFGKINPDVDVWDNLGPHDVSVLLRLAGATPEHVSGWAAAHVREDKPDIVKAQLSFAGGLHGFAYVSCISPFKEHRIVVIGSENMASYDDVSKKLLLYDARAQMRDGAAVLERGEAREIVFAEGEPLLKECAAFLRSMETRKPPISDGASGLLNLRVMDAVRRSWDASGAPCTLATEEIC